MNVAWPNLIGMHRRGLVMTLKVLFDMWVDGERSEPTHLMSNESDGEPANHIHVRLNKNVSGALCNVTQSLLSEWPGERSERGHSDHLCK